MNLLQREQWHQAGASDFFCFGGGRGLRMLVACLRKLGWLDRLVAVVDNRSSSWGSTLSIGEHQWPVISPEELRATIGGRSVIISCLAREEIQTQLEGYPELQDTTVAFYRDIVEESLIEFARQMTFPHGVRRTDKPLIPKIIHYCWFGGNPIPSEFQQYIEGWKRMCPDYEIRRWDESNYDVTKNAYMKDAYDAKKWGFVPDYARLDILYQYGGFYLDTDVELVKPLDDLRYNKVCMGMEKSDCVALGLGVGAVPHHPLIKELRDAYESYQFVDFHKRSEFLEGKIIASPTLQSKVLEPLGFQYDCCQLQDLGDIRIYPLPVLCGLVAGTVVLTEYTYAIHHSAGTWIPKE